MAVQCRYDSKKLLLGAIDRGERIMVRAIDESGPDELSGNLAVLLKTKKFITVTNKNNAFFVQFTLDRKGKIKAC